LASKVATVPVFVWMPKISDLGHEVKVSGHLYKDGSVHVEKIAPAS
jgi:hypothetical protein